VGDVKSRTRKRAVGTRDRVMSHLTTVGEVRDENGMASTVLAEAIGYPGSSIAFAQLLSGMERSGLIEREVRGKRTYLITPAGVTARAKPGRPQPGSRPRTRSAGPQGSAQRAAAGPGRHPARTDEAGTPESVTAAKPAGEFDYDELARRLLIQVVRRLAASPAEGPELAPVAAAPPLALTSQPSTSQLSRPLEETVASLEQKLASVQTRQRTLSEENAKLLEQLREAQRCLALVQERASRPRITEQLNNAEGVLLDRLLWLAEEQRSHGEAETG
jgi:hypothetical protein